jgi:DNA-binding FadR family transcriptional regulator
MTSPHDSDAELLTRPEGATAAAAVAEDLVRRIVAGLPPGTSLASEAELAAGYGVSRVTVREAIKMLAGRGLLDLGRGRRAVVREPDGAALGEFMSWIVQYDPKGVFDLVEVRLSLEVQSAGLAARRATRPALAAIEATMAAMRAAAGPLDAGDAEAGGPLRTRRAPPPARFTDIYPRSIAETDAGSGAPAAGAAGQQWRKP